MERHGENGLTYSSHWQVMRRRKWDTPLPMTRQAKDKTAEDMKLGLMA